MLGYKDKEKEKSWKQHYERLLNDEFPWCEGNLSEAYPVLGPSTFITQAMTKKSISKIKKAKHLVLQVL